MPFYFETSLHGILKFELKGNNISWMNEDVFFAKSICDLVSNTIEANERKRIEERVILQKEEILAKNDELKRQQNEIKQINENLEKKIKERTLILEKKNYQLQEYTYINSHLLRGPLCRILGLIYIIENKLYPEGSETEFLGHLKESADELDTMIKGLTKTLEEENHFDLSSLENKDRFSPN
jgi:signal transduction histidine kinase